MTLADLPAIQQLSREEKLGLAALWDDIIAQPGEGSLPVPAQEAALLDQRLAAYQATPKSSLSLEKFAHQLAAQPHG